jgi:hypothetical protein
MLKLVASAAAAAAESDTVAAPPCELPPDAGFCDALALVGAGAALALDVFVADAAAGAFVLEASLVAGAAAAVPVCTPVDRPAATAGLNAVAVLLTDATLPITIVIPPWLTPWFDLRVEIDLLQIVHRQLC